MKYDKFGKVSVNPTSCRYGGSRLVFRGPDRPVGGRFIAFVGGSETYGRFVAQPYPVLVEQRLGEVCINFAQAGASAEAFVHDPFVKEACRNAALTIVAVTGAHNLSNRLYSVHPRRNDRFIKPSDALRVLYPQVDFAEINFTRHLLLCLHQANPDHFSIVKEELQLAWLARMQALLDHIGPNVVLLWLTPDTPSPEETTHALGVDPLFVTAEMVSELRPLVRDTVHVVAPRGRATGMQTDHLAHDNAASHLLQPIRTVLQNRDGARASRASAYPCGNEQEGEVTDNYTSPSSEVLGS